MVNKFLKHKEEPNSGAETKPAITASQLMNQRVSECLLDRRRVEILDKLGYVESVQTNESYHKASAGLSVIYASPAYSTSGRKSVQISITITELSEGLGEFSLTEGVEFEFGSYSLEHLKLIEDLVSIWAKPLDVPSNDESLEEDDLVEEDDLEEEEELEIAYTTVG